MNDPKDVLIVTFAGWIAGRSKLECCHDHACAQCVPDGPIVIDGFVCVPHQAQAIVAGARPMASVSEDPSVHNGINMCADEHCSAAIENDQTMCPRHTRLPGAVPEVTLKRRASRAQRTSDATPEHSDQAKWYVKARVYGAIAAEYQRALESIAHGDMRPSERAKEALAWRHSEKGGVPRRALDEIGLLLRPEPCSNEPLLPINEEAQAVVDRIMRENTPEPLTLAAAAKEMCVALGFLHYATHCPPEDEPCLERVVNAENRLREVLRLDDDRKYGPRTGQPVTGADWKEAYLGLLSKVRDAVDYHEERRTDYPRLAGFKEALEIYTTKDADRCTQIPPRSAEQRIGEAFEAGWTASQRSETPRVYCSKCSGLHEHGIHCPDRGST